MSGAPHDPESFAKDILAALKAPEWSAEELAEVERELASGKYDFPEWLVNLPGMVILRPETNSDDPRP